MSLDSTLRGLAAEIGQSRTVTGSVAAPAKLRHRTGTITAYTAGALTASVQIGGDIVDAPFLATYSPGVGDAVSVLINNGSPLILGPVNKAPASAGSAIEAFGFFTIHNIASFTGPNIFIQFDDAGSDPGFFALTHIDGIDTLVTGQYQGTASVFFTGCTAGDTFVAVLTNGGGATGFGAGIGIANAAGEVYISCTTGVAADRAAGADQFQLTLEQISGGTAWSLRDCDVEIVKFRE